MRVKYLYSLWTVPCGPRSKTPQVLDYHDRLIAGAGPLFSHFLASVPYILEELARVGVALTRLAQVNSKDIGQTFSLFEVDAFDGTNGRALTGHSHGLIRRVTLEELVSALSAHFKSVHLLWSSSNFCEFVASDDPEQVEQFLDLMSQVVQPPEFCFEAARLGTMAPSLSGGKDLADA